MKFPIITTSKVHIVAVILKVGEIYDVTQLEIIGWTCGDGSGHNGYNLFDYFDATGQYLGADQYGIEPTVLYS